MMQSFKKSTAIRLIEDSLLKHAFVKTDQQIPVTERIAQSTRYPYRQYTTLHRGKKAIIVFDVVGAKSPLAEAEIMSCVNDISDSMKVPLHFSMNHMQIFTGLLQRFKVPEEFHSNVITILCTHALQAVSARQERFTKIGLSTDLARDLSQSFETQAESLIEQESDAQAQLEQVQEAAKLYGINPMLDLTVCHHDATMVIKGATVETPQTVMELRRYSVGDVPTLSGTIHLQPLIDQWELNFPQTLTEALIISMVGPAASTALVQSLRAEGIRAEIDLMDRGISKNLQYADAKQIPFCLVIGEAEIKSNTVQIKLMREKKQEQVPVTEVADYLRRHKTFFL